MSKDDYIRLISKRGDSYGNYLVKLMDEYNCNNLHDIKLEQAKDFYERLVRNEKIQ